MNRSEFLATSSRLACGSCLALIAGSRLGGTEAPAAEPETPVDEALKRARYENAFTNNWMTDLFEAIDREVDPAVQLRLMQACGEGCYRRHAFKQDLAAEGRGDVDRLLAAYRRNFRIEREADLVHIRYGDHCFCPAARNRPPRPNDLHCECTRFTHETIFANALGRHIRVELVESVRRGGKTCHLIAHLA
ncbi:MAG TPA: hypothetical protein VG734_25010 [Lacunisphaera sp.]|nr:hypothetical protein [Lacunisphaera sp.]